MEYKNVDVFCQVLYRLILCCPSSSKVVATRISQKTRGKKTLKLILQVFIDSSKVFASLHEA